MTTPTDALVERECVVQLRDHQTQLDFDGCMVGVSRQAIDETLAALGAAEDEIGRLREAMTDAIADIESGNGLMTAETTTLPICEKLLRRTGPFDLAIYTNPDGPEAAAIIEGLVAALELGLEYWAHRQQRYKNRHPVWVQQAEAALKAAGVPKP